MTLLESLEKIQCDCERYDFLRDAISTRAGLCRELTQLGFDGSVVPTDWRSYFTDEELRGFILEYVE